MPQFVKKIIFKPDAPVVEPIMDFTKAANDLFNFQKERMPSVMAKMKKTLLEASRRIKRGLDE